eukprot:244158-Rhodomonas_salina.1
MRAESALRGRATRRRAAERHGQEGGGGEEHTQSQEPHAGGVWCRCRGSSLPTGAVAAAPRSQLVRLPRLLAPNRRGSSLPTAARALTRCPTPWALRRGCQRTRQR